MSGGVDSSVAAALLVEAGYDVIGATMKLFCYGDSVPNRPCCSLDSITDAKLVAHRLGIPHYVVSLEDRFGRDVIGDFVAEYARGPTPGPLVTADGAVVGEHEGFARYTIGQRRGLPGGFRAPMYVVAIRPETREVVIGPGDELFGHEVRLEDVNWLADPLAAGDETFVQCRYRAKAAAARVRETGPGTLVLDLAEPVRAITPGQSG